MMAFTAGSTVLTPTSQGNSKQSPEYWGILWGNLFKLDDCHKIDACHDGALEKHNSEHVLHETSFTPSPVMTVQKRGENSGKRRYANEKWRKSKGPRRITNYS
jgi:hypothetical protein